jgi:predicted nicotinamide N-methyase
VLVGDPDRRYMPRMGFEAVATYRVPGALTQEDAEVKPSTVWRLR